MAQAAQLETFAAGEETAVDVARIERQLRELWELAAHSESESTQCAISRACLFNFIVYCENEAARDHATAVISELTSRDPCRAIVLLAEDAGSEAGELNASITAHCHLAGGGHKQVCCEQISIHATGTGITHLGTAVLPLLESDLPTILWWQGNFLEQPDLFRRLLGVTDRLVYDTSMWPVGFSLEQLAAALAGNPRCNFSDLSWTRLTQWRKLTADCFDDVTCRGALAGMQEVEVTHGCGPGARLRALMYGCWVATQLGWPASEAGQRIRLISRAETDGTGVGLLSAVLRSPGATVTVRKQHGEATASSQITMPDVCGLPRKRALWPTDDAALLAQELDRFTPHHVYARVLTLTAHIQA